MAKKEPTWIFGYGSLLWKVDFKYDEKVIGYVEGFERKFWQGSPDHRGVPEKPGRVVTLIEKLNSIVWGAAYKLPMEEEKDILKRLNHREKEGYKTIETTFHPRYRGTHPKIQLLIYIGTPDNPHFVGPETLTKISDVIVQSVGPSGPNTDYLFNLAEFVRKHIPEDDDDHLFELEKIVRRRMAVVQG